MNISVHDNSLISYAVNEKEKTILFETVFLDGVPHEYTNVIFSGVLAYFFEDHSIEQGTIIFDISEIETHNILDSNWKRFEERRKWGWPGSWAKTKEIAIEYFKEHDIKGYEISSSCGLCGWVLAKNIEFFEIKK